MNILSIEKSVYRKKLNITSVAFIGVFAILSLVFGSIIISLFAAPIVDPETQSNFRYNLAGVILALVTMAMIANSLKGRPYFKEVYYVWQLKQLHNRIYRKHANIKAAQGSDDEEKSEMAKTIQAYYYTTLKQVYELDDNTLTISKVNSDIERLKQLVGEERFEQMVEQFDKSLLDNF